MDKFGLPGPDDQVIEKDEIVIVRNIVGVKLIEKIRRKYGIFGICYTVGISSSTACANIRIVPQAHAYVIERLGAYQATWSVGVHVKVPLIDRVVKKYLLRSR